jgi:hypothetical protein
MMRGETVYVGETAVDNVLVGTTGFFKGAREEYEIRYPVGPVADFTLYFPISYTDDLTNKRVTVRGIECDVINVPAHENPESVFESWVHGDGFGEWDMTVYAQRVQPAYAETISVYQTTVTRDYLGDRTAGKPTLLYSGPAQVRLSQEVETAKQGATRTDATYYFVMPHIAGIDALPAQCVTVVYNEQTFDVEQIENVDEKGDTTSLRAVRHG